MYYLKSLFFNFLAVFFANHILPGIAVINQTKLPHLGSDLPTAFVLGLVNSLIYPMMRSMGAMVTIMKLILFSLGVNLIAYAVIKILPIGIEITSWEGYLFPAVLVAIASFWTNYLEFKHGRQHPHKTEPPAPE